MPDEFLALDGIVRGDFEWSVICFILVGFGEILS